MKEEESEEEGNGKSGWRLLETDCAEDEWTEKEVELEMEGWRMGGGKYPVNTSCGIIDEALGVMAARGSPHQGGNQNPAERQREDKEPSRGAALTLNPPLLCADAS